MRPEKQLLLDDIKSRMNASRAFVLTRYHKLEPNRVAGFRSALAQTGGALEVVKKRVLIKAAAVAGVSLDLAALGGHIAVIFLDQDPFATTKLIYKFSEEQEKGLDILCGRFEGVMCSAQEVQQISKLPNKDEMRAQLIGVLEAPLSQTLAVVEALLTSVMHCLENKNQQNQS